ncbi:unnamed protein product [Vitrella brassicaformis CCMP3155]|uniref:Uncharacterized protein n=1 Tax=Vitrella brassicaformis (strain CCMP3155) TaxID=1169540 RepID=A0A0G4FQ68_VITBC|nr:unnamed protein product [Vitrella brassicaformis CCMP3155]|eukprot:CEM15980.1 unnamed protein product [Vitrella brassicaformis CCMP3155]
MGGGQSTCGELRAQRAHLLVDSQAPSRPQKPRVKRPRISGKRLAASGREPLLGSDSVLEIDENGAYLGPLAVGQRSGWAVQQTADHLYEGEFESSKKHGWGALTWLHVKDAVQVTYFGDFESDLPSGNGVLVHPKGHLITITKEGARFLFDRRSPCTPLKTTYRQPLPSSSGPTALLSQASTRESLSSPMHKPLSPKLSPSTRFHLPKFLVRSQATRIGFAGVRFLSGGKDDSKEPPSLSGLRSSDSEMSVGQQSFYRQLQRDGAVFIHDNDSNRKGQRKYESMPTPNEDGFIDIGEHYERDFLALPYINAPTEEKSKSIIAEASAAKAIEFGGLGLPSPRQ